MSFLKIDNLKRSSIYVTPNFPSLQTRRYKFSLFGVIKWFVLFFFFVLVLAISILAFTPAKNLVFLLENEKLEKQKIVLEKLETRVTFLTRELESMTALNKRMKYALILASTDSLDSTAAIYDSLRAYKKERNFTPEGNLYALIKSYFGEDPIYSKPSNGIITKKFLPGKGHLGVDYSALEGEPIRASKDGVVVFAEFSVKNGNIMIIQCDDGILTIYKHCGALLKNVREFVKSGETIALMGNTGYNSSGPHLHFEIWKNGKPIDPLNILLK